MAEIFSTAWVGPGKVACSWVKIRLKIGTTKTRSAVKMTIMTVSTTAG